MSACFWTVGSPHSIPRGQPTSATAVTVALEGIGEPSARAAAGDRRRSKRHGRATTPDANRTEACVAWIRSRSSAGRAGRSAMTLTCLLFRDQQQQLSANSASSGMNIRVRGPTGQTTLTGEAHKALARWPMATGDTARQGPIEACGTLCVCRQ